MNTDSRINAEQDIETFSMRNFFLLCLGYWKWFLISIIVFVGMGLFYAYTRQPVYERSEEILVKDQEGGGGIGDIASAFSGLSLFSSNTSVYNELISFTSPAVMFEVVDRLNLTMNYEMRKGMRRQTLYGTSLPVNMEFPELSEKDGVTLRLKLFPDGKYEISKIRLIAANGQQKIEETVSGTVGDQPISTPIGNIIVKRNEYYVPNPSVDQEEIEIDVFKQPRQLAVEKYVAKLKGDLTDQDADVIKLTIMDTSVERADDILNTVVDVYGERWINDNNRMAIATSQFISDRLALIEKELGEVDDVIADQKSAMKIPDLEEAAKGYMAENFKMNEELLKTTNMLAMTQYLKEYLQDPQNVNNIIPINTGTENNSLEREIGEYNEVLIARDKLSENSSAENPLVRDLNKELQLKRAAIMRSIDSHIANLKNILANTSKAQSTTNDKLSSSPQQAKTLLSIERQQLVMQELYLFLLQKREENELSKAFTADNTRIITPPYGKQKPVSPKKFLIILVTFFLGVGIPGVALFIAESSNTKIRSKKDIENLPVPFAGEIPRIGKNRRLSKIFQSKKKKRKEVDKPKIVVSEGKRDIPNEAFRVVRSNIDFMIGRSDSTVLALTSFNPGSGKSFIAFNLAASFALKGKKVLLIDGDLRHGSISLYVDSPRKGLSNYLTGNADNWQSLLVRMPDFKDMEVMPIGHRPPNPAELLDNGKLEVLIEEAKHAFDIILIDCPPVNIVVDTQIINQYVNRTLFVVRAGLLEKKALGDINNLVEEKKLHNITVLLNDTKTEFSSYHTYGNYEAIDNV